MQIVMACPIIKLAPAQTLRIRDGAGLRIACLRGAIWLTQEGDARDIFLDAQEQFTLDRPGLTLIQASHATEIRLERHIVRPRQSGAAVALEQNFHAPDDIALLVRDGGPCCPHQWKVSRASGSLSEGGGQ